MKWVVFGIYALLMDGMQFAIGGAVMVIAAFPGTVGGAAAGCAAGAAIAGDIGCSVGAFLLGLLGSIPLVNGALALVTLPIGNILGIVISICISATFGAGLAILLIFNRSFYPKIFLPGAIGESLPVFGFLPVWTGIVAASFFEYKKREALQKKTAAPTSAANDSTPQAATSFTVNRGMDGIRGPATNDNNPRSAERYAA